MAKAFTVHSYTSPPEAFFVNSYWLEVEDGVIVIDTQFLISQAQNLRKEIEATGKPIIAVIITHPHPDHFNGTGTLLEGSPSVPVYSTQATYDVIKATEAEKLKEWKGIYGADYPDTLLLPNTIVASEETASIGGLDFHFRDIGPIESHNETLIDIPAERILFCGDLVYNHVHSWLKEGRSSAWLEQLGFVLKNYAMARTVYSGHGKPTTLLGLNQQISYINTYQMLIRAELEKAGSLTEAGRNAIKAKVEELYPDEPLAMLEDSNINGIAAELTGVL